MHAPHVYTHTEILKAYPFKTRNLSHDIMPFFFVCGNNTLGRNQRHTGTLMITPDLIGSVVTVVMERMTGLNSYRKAN